MFASNKEPSITQGPVYSAGATAGARFAGWMSCKLEPCQGCPSRFNVNLSTETEILSFSFIMNL